jgi:hypothetical protein
MDNNKTAAEIEKNNAAALKVTDLEVIMDNGGGITVQCDEFAHRYDDAKQAARDVKAILEGDDTSDWDGNNPDDRMTYAQNDIRNGGVKVYDDADLLAEIAKAEEIEPWGYNDRDFLATLTGRTVSDNCGY